MRLGKYLSIAVAAVLLAILPLVFNSNAFLNFLIYTLIITLAAQGWNLLGGVAGQTSFGHAAMFGTGAYAISLWQINLGMGAWSGLIVAIAAGALVAWLIGFVAFRAGLKGSYFALVTLAFAEVLRVVANSSPVTGGASGLLLPIKAGMANFQFSDRTYFYWIALIMVVIGLVLMRWIEHSRFGAQLIAVRENEEAAKALGIDTFKVKLRAMTISGAMAAAGGCLYVQYYLYIDSMIVLGPKISVEVLLASLVGGLGTVFGPLVGTLALHILGEGAKLFAGEIPGIDVALYGAVLIAAVWFMPRGLLSLGDKFRARKAAHTPRNTQAVAEERP